MIEQKNLFVILSKKLRIVTCIDIGLFIGHCVRTLKHQTVAFSMLWLLLFSFEEKMLLSSLVNKFKEKCTIDNKIVTGLKKRWFFGLRLLPSGTYGRWKGKEDFLQIYTINMDFHLICILNHERKQKLFQLKKIISKLIFLCLRKERLIDFF